MRATGDGPIDVAGAKADEIERAMANGEGLTAAALRNIDQGGFPPSVPDRGAIASFVGLQFARTPATRRWLGKLATMFFGDAAVELLDDPVEVRQIWKDAHGREPTEDELADLTKRIKDRRFTARVGAEPHIGVMLAVADRAYPLLMELSWFLAETSDLATGDMPVANWARPDSRRMELGLGTADEITMPISPATCLIIARPSNIPDEKVQLKEAAAERLRQRIWLSADRFTFRRPGTPPPSGIDPRARDDREA